MRLNTCSVESAKATAAYTNSNNPNTPIDLKSMVDTIDVISCSLRRMLSLASRLVSSRAASLIAATSSALATSDAANTESVSEAIS